VARARRNGDLDLVGTYEAHLILGVERSRIARWLDENARGKAKIPEPAGRLRVGDYPGGRLKCGPIWRRAAIEGKLRELAAEAGVDPDGEAFDGWAAGRSAQRARQMKPPLPVDELEAIIRRPVPARAARELRRAAAAA
jgi:hypothetical protein